MVTTCAAAVVTWPTASHRPATRNQTILEKVDMEPLPLTGCTTERPNGHRAKLAMRNDATPAGMVTMKMQAIMPKMK